MSAPIRRERKWWTQSEDAILQNAAQIQISEQGSVKNWNEVAALLPGRSNKDCRKRYSKVSVVRKGAWTPEEDERLQQAIAQEGFKWSSVARIMESRNGDQCAKRWEHVLGPGFKHAPWTLKEDRILENAVARVGNNWKEISLSVLPDRSTHDIRNRSVALNRRRARRSITSSPKPVTDNISEDEGSGGSPRSDDMEIIYDSHTGKMPSLGDNFEDTTCTRLGGSSDEHSLLGFSSMDQLSHPSWEMFDLATSPQQPLFNTHPNHWGQFETPTDWTSMLDENAFDFSMLEGDFKNISENQGEPSQARLAEGSSRSSPDIPEKDEKKSSITVTLKGGSSLTHELLESLMKVHGDLTIHVLKD